MNKKGVSPLIATVLLVGIVITLAVVIWFWYSNVLYEETQKSDITGGQACALEVEYSLSDLCVDRNIGSLFFKSQNDGTIAISRFRVIIEDSSGAALTYQTSQGLAVAETKEIGVSYDDSTITSLERVEITPFVYSSGGKYCTEQKREFSDIDDC